jgi:calcineurin-like phosphoesterase family protein
MSDPHFGHRKMVEFTRADGTKLRPFDTVEEMDRAIVERWNACVADGDRVYLLGDVAFNRRSIQPVRELKGRKVLVRGNHDELNLRDYAELFDDVRGLVSKPNFVMSHAPIHPSCMDRWKLNIHGHLHDKTLDDPRYACVSVEQTGYAPVLVDDLLRARGILD